MEADVGDGDIHACFPTQASVLPEAMPDTCETDAVKEQNHTVFAVAEMFRGLWGEIRWALTVADSSDDPKDEEPEEHVSGVAQQQDEEQADHHGYHQSTAATQTPEDLTQSDSRKQIYQVC